MGILGHTKRLWRRLKLAFGCYEDFSLQVHTFYGDNLRQDIRDTTMVYIGDLDMATYLLDHGVREFYKTDPKHCVASIGFNPKTKSWFGWSHRASAEYCIGKRIAKGFIGYEEMWNYLKDRRSLPSNDIYLKDLDECRKMAEIFARNVS